MTCIAAWVSSDGKVTVGADSAITKDSTQMISKVPKIFISDNMIIGIAGNTSQDQLVRYRVVIPRIQNTDTAMRDLLEFALNIKEKVTELKAVSNDAPVTSDIELLVGFEGNIYLISPDFAVICSANRYEAIGSGSSYAMGAMHRINSTTPDIDPKEAITFALDAASTHDNCVSKPYHFFSKRAEALKKE